MGVSRRGVPRERLHDLLGRPRGRGGVGDVDMKDASPVVSQDDEDEQDLEHHCRHDEEVDGDEVADVVLSQISVGGRSCPATRLRGNRS
jgi:hypothetical protein